MTFSDPRLLLLILALLAACMIIALQFLQIRKLRRTLQKDSQDRAGGEKAQTRQGEFQSSLLEATLKSRLESSSNWRRTPEKYRYASALAEQGANAERIAELLQLPLAEVQQLIALRKAKGGG
ncbi:MAG: hypothetical protein R2940_03205 [Syntrophotaleaceae bacterium]